jgi:hypothetical protein
MMRIAYGTACQGAAGSADMEKEGKAKESHDHAPAESWIGCRNRGGKMRDRFPSQY